MSEVTLQIPVLLTTVAVVGGGMTGALHATHRRMDIAGIAIVALCTGVGGGAIRDVLLGHAVPAFLLQSWLVMALIGALAGYFFARFVEHLSPAIYVIDSLLIGVWVVFGAEKALHLGLSNSAAILLGVITAVGGGMIRDVLCRETPTALMPGKWVAAAAALAAVIFVGVDSLAGHRLTAEIVAIGFATGLRLASARFGWTTPTAVATSQRISRFLGLSAAEDQNESVSR